MLASSQSQRFFVLWESEGIASSVLGDFFASFEIGGDPAMFLERKVLLSVLSGFSKLLGFGFRVLCDEIGGFFGHGAKNTFC